MNRGSTLLLALLCAWVVDAQTIVTCTNPGSIAMQCQDPDYPFCVQTGYSPAVYTCSECSSDCDCPIGKYCSGNLLGGTAGTCVTFQAEGKKCVPYTSSQLNSANYASTYKCADVYIGTNIYADAPQNAVCLEGVCRSCNPNTDNINSMCSNGLRSVRTCAAPGKIVSPNKFYWLPVNYGQDPEFVWLAVFFPFIIIVTIVQIVTLVVICKNSKLKWAGDLNKISSVAQNIMPTPYESLRGQEISTAQTFPPSSYTSLRDYNGAGLGTNRNNAQRPKY